MKALYTLISARRGVGTLLLFPLVAVLLAAIATMPGGFAGGVAGGERPSLVAAYGTPHYLPAIRNDPTATATAVPTATPMPSVPDFVTHIPLPEAQCPFTVGFNTFTGYTYIVNSHSDNATVMQGTNVVTHIDTGGWPHNFAAVPNSPRVFITNLHSQVSVIDGLNVTAYIPNHYEPYGVAYNPVNGYAYISDLDSTVQIVDGTTLLTNLYINDAENPAQGAGWLRGIVADPTTGLVYVASWERGRMYVIDGMEVTATYRLGWKPLSMALDPVRGYLYITHTDPDENEAYPHNISVFSLATKSVTAIKTAARSRHVAIDHATGLVYVTNPEDNNITLLQGTDVLGNLPAGKEPWGVAVNPNTGYVFVANRGEASAVIYRHGAPVTTIQTLGMQPFAVGVDTITNYVYIANRGELFYDDYDRPYCHNASVTILR
jgi:DNA-binding beta-propeller fold protein YncE